MMTESKHKNWLAGRNYVSFKRWEAIGTSIVNIVVFCLLFVYLFPILFMVSTAFMESYQLMDRYSPPYPGRQLRYPYDGKERMIYLVPFGDQIRELALVAPGKTTSQFIDPQDPESGLIEWHGSWRTLKHAYSFHMTLDNFGIIFRSLRLTQMVRNTLLMTLISMIGVL
ncbi:MAG: hypothetical protein EHM70_01470, partial [Chloroflexota bacterium]